MMGVRNKPSTFTHIGTKNSPEAAGL